MSSSLQKRAGNRALRTNPPNANIHLGRWGSDWGYVVFCVMAASLIGLLIWSTKLARNRRTFHYLFIPVLAISSVAWYSMASDLGATPVTVQFRHNSPLGPGSRYPTRQIWFARYIDWTLTTSFLLLSLLLITALPLSVIFITLFFNVLMIVCGLLGALTPTRYKWAYFVSAMPNIIAVPKIIALTLVSSATSARCLHALHSATFCITSLHRVYARLDGSEAALEGRT
jgi:bacteriorhodopsin